MKVVYQGRHWTQALTWLFAVPSLVYILTLYSPSGFAAKRHYGERVLMGEHYLVFDDTCVLMFAAMSSGSFFDSLERVQSADGTTYRWNSKPWKYYPSDLRVDVYGKRLDCPKNLPWSIRVAGNATRFMKNVDMKLGWKNNLEFFPIEDSTLATKEPSRESNQDMWEYTFQLHPKDILLSFHLVVSVFDLSHELVVRFSGRP